MSIASILGLVYNILRIGRQILSTRENFLRNRKTKEKYKEGHDVIENGDIDKINDMLKNHKN